jgi:hypothetical protein
VQQVAERKAILLRLDPTIHAALQRWASAECRSFNAHVDYLLRKALKSADRFPCADEENRTCNKSASR